jgi:peroxiredoxin
MTLTVFGLILPWLLVGLSWWLGFQFLRQMGRVLLRLDALEQQLRQLQLQGLPSAPPPAPPPPPGLAVGAEAPAFELPSLAGERLGLSQYRGRKVLLVFFNPQCGFCTQMVPALAALPVDGRDGRPLPLVVTTGNVDENRRLFEKAGIKCPVLVQEQMTIASRYQVNGTPIGYLIDEKGAIASAQAVGAEALLALAGPPGSAVKGQEPDPASHAAHANGKANLGLENSRINRSGLKAGTPAPDFRLPRLTGGESGLRDWRGRRVLLVFSDPQCGPCDQLAPQLEQHHRLRKDILILMVSRREPEANRDKAAKLGLTFPIVLQEQWEISKLYGMFATPIGYLINEEGILASDVAVGVEPILALLAGPVTGPSETKKTNGEKRNGQAALPAAQHAPR